MSLERRVSEKEDIVDAMASTGLPMAWGESGSFIVKGNVYFTKLFGLGHANLEALCQTQDGRESLRKLSAQNGGQAACAVIVVMGLPDGVAHLKVRSFSWANGVAWILEKASHGELRLERLEIELAELRSFQRDIVARERLATLGELFAGFAHEINAPLGNALLTASVCDAGLEQLRAAVFGGVAKKNEVAKLFEKAKIGQKLVREEVEAAIGLVGEFRQLGDASEEPRFASIRDVVEMALADLQPRMSAGNVGLMVDIEPSLRTSVKAVVLGKILTRLVDNSLRHAFALGYGSEVVDKRVSVSARRVGEQIMLTVEDNGVGMGSQDLERAFDPFFTTRRQDGCRGLGLHAAHTMAVGALGGALMVASAPESGFAARLAFPAMG